MNVYTYNAKVRKTYEEITVKSHKCSKCGQESKNYRLSERKNHKSLIICKDCGHIVDYAHMKTTKQNNEQLKTSKLGSVLGMFFEILFMFLVLAGLVFGIGAFIFCGRASSRPLAESANTITEKNLWENLHILDDIIVSIKTVSREFVGASMEGTPIKTIALKALPIVSILFVFLVFLVIIVIKLSNKDKIIVEEKAESKLKK